MRPDSTFSNRTASLASFSGRSKAPPLRSCTRKVSSAMPLDKVRILASTMLAPASASAPAMLREQAGMVGGVERHLGHGARRIDARIDGQGRRAALGRAGQAGVARQDLRLERQPVERIALGDEGVELGRAEVGQQRAHRLLIRLDPRIARVADEPARHQLDGAVVELAQQGRLPAVPHLRARPRGCRRR